MGKRYYDNYDYEEAYKEQCKKGRMCQDHNGGQHGGVIGNRV